MIKVSVLYPVTEGARFDHEYYRSEHLPLVARLLGAACVRYSVDKGISGGEPGSPPAFVAMCHIYSDTVEEFQAGFGPNADKILGDIPNYTEIAPIMLISEVVEE